MNDLAIPAGSNVPEYTVSEISGAVKRTLEGNFGRVRVRGEITELKRYPSGHIYFSLKDEGAKISGVVWKSSVSRLGMVPENGVEVIATGRVSSYGERSSYQLITERMEFAGAGALLARIEMLRVRLAAEGLFDADRKKPLPVLPLVVGVVSSERGAVIQDIRTTIARRFPRTILLWPVPVQGEGAAERIAAAIEGFCRVDPQPDVLIVARGGGSLEDLMAFNEEVVVRAVAACRIPLISAVGHETDTTLIDYRRRSAGADADRCGRTCCAGAGRSGGRHGAQGRAPHRRAEPASPRNAGCACRARSGGCPMRRHCSAARGSGWTIALNGWCWRCRTCCTSAAPALDAAGRQLPDLPGMLKGARERVQERGLRLIIALPNVVQRRRGALDLCGQKLVAGLRHALAASTAGPGVRSAALRLRHCGECCAKRGHGWTAPARGLNPCRRLRCCNVAMRWCPMPPATR